MTSEVIVKGFWRRVLSYLHGECFNLQFRSTLMSIKIGSIHIGYTNNSLEVIELYEQDINYSHTKVKIKCSCGREKTTSIGSFLKSKNCNMGRCRVNFINIDNKKFGTLVVVEDLLNKKVAVRCDCGKLFQTRKDPLLQGKVKSCGKGLCIPRTKDLTGKKFGYLTAIRYLPQSNRGSRWECKCDCGNIKSYFYSDLVRFKTKSCGCKKSEMISKSLSFTDILSLKMKILRGYKNHAIDLNIKFEIPEDYFYKLILQKCHYCGALHSNTATSTNQRFLKYNGVDRKDCNKNYTIDNCVACCKTCNFAKRTLSYDDFINLIKSIFNNLNLGTKNEQEL